MCVWLYGCAAMQTQQSPLPMQPANQIVVKPIFVEPPATQIKYQLINGNNPALNQAFNRYIATGQADNIVTDGFEQFAYDIGQQPIIDASPFQLTEISLEPGELLTNVSSGDPTRWSYSYAYSGMGDTKQLHILIKPSRSMISTNLVITTTKRAYNLKMVSTTNGRYVKDVRFWYPDEIQSYWNNFNATQQKELDSNNTCGTTIAPDVNINQLNFNYSIRGGNCFSHMPSWSPIRVFDDGTHTYIQFPTSISSGDMPALFVMNGCSEELVNYRSKPPYFVVDKIFNQAVLLEGVGRNQTRVQIINNNT